ncbi:hypothetical protein SBADM41S_10571 [Streptomyces badius]
MRAVSAAIGLLAGALTATTVGASPAAALTPPVAIPADDLSTWQTNGIVWSMAAGDGVVHAGGTFAVAALTAASGTNEQPAVNFAAFDAATGAPPTARCPSPSPRGPRPSGRPPSPRTAKPFTRAASSVRSTGSA